MRGSPTIYFQSLNRPFTVLGVDRQLFFLFVGLTLPIAFAARLSPIMDVVALVIFLIFYVIGVLITRLDYQMLPIYRRHIHYHKYYAAIAGIHTKIPMLKPSVPVYQGKRGLV